MGFFAHKSRNEPHGLPIRPDPYASEVVNLARFANPFEGITWMQVGAGALAAATALFLSSSIGIAGSIIGAAVGSVVTTLSSNVYKTLFTASNDAIKKKMGVHDGEAGEDDATARPETAPKAHGNAGPAPDITQTMPRTPAHSTVAMPPAQAASLGTHRARSPHVAFPSRSANEVERVKAVAARTRAQRRERLAIVVAFVTGLVSVGICAAVILGATDGNGIGYRPAPAVQRTPQITDETVPAAQDGGADQNTPAQEPSDTSQAVPQGAESQAGSSGQTAGTTVTSPQAEAPSTEGGSSGAESSQAEGGAAGPSSGTQPDAEAQQPESPTEPGGTAQGGTAQGGAADGTAQGGTADGTENPGDATSEGSTGGAGTGQTDTPAAAPAGGEAGTAP